MDGLMQSTALDERYPPRPLGTNTSTATIGSFNVVDRDVDLASTVSIGTARNVAEV